MKYYLTRFQYEKLWKNSESYRYSYNITREQYWNLFYKQKYKLDYSEELQHNGNYILNYGHVIGEEKYINMLILQL
jgi:hypothetical protein